MTNVARSTPAVLFIAYVIAYVALRWQNVLIRTASYQSSVGFALYESSRVRAGFWYGGTPIERMKQAAAAPAEFVFRPLCIAEAELRNRFFPKVNIER
jgi:hypothetical protein